MGGTGHDPGSAPDMLPFIDDYMLFFAHRMREALVGTRCQVQTAWLTDGSDLSYRQLVSVLPHGPDILL